MGPNWASNFCEVNVRVIGGDAYVTTCCLSVGWWPVTVCGRTINPIHVASHFLFPSSVPSVSWVLVWCKVAVSSPEGIGHWGTWLLLCAKVLICLLPVWSVGANHPFPLCSSLNQQLSWAQSNLTLVNINQWVAFPPFTRNQVLCSPLVIVKKKIAIYPQTNQQCGTNTWPHCWTQYSKNSVLLPVLLLFRPKHASISSKVAARAPMWPGTISPLMFLYIDWGCHRIRLVPAVHDGLPKPTPGRHFPPAELPSETLNRWKRIISASQRSRHQSLTS